MTPAIGPDTFTALVVAKAPVPGLAKTRLAADIGAAAAAEIAAAAFLDTLYAVRECPAHTRFVALTGQLTNAVLQAEISAVLEDFVVIEQRGSGLAERLINAHADAGAASTGPIIQVGMDTPQITAELLTQASTILRSNDRAAVLGPACDGGWWILGVHNAADTVAIAGIPMSRPDTGAKTRAALAHTGLDVEPVAVLRDVDYVDDLEPVAELCSPESRFRTAVHSLNLQ